MSADVQLVHDLDLSRLPMGRITRLWLAMGEDELGLPLRIPLLVARGVRDGPVAGITAAVHGDEVNGIPAIHSLFRKLDPERMRGSVVGVPVVNTVAYSLHQRRMPEGADLNHAFPGAEAGNSSQQYAHHVMDRVVRHVDFLMDLHTASRGRVNSLYVRADMTEEPTATMAYLQRPQIILHNPPSDGTLRGEADDRGIPAITVEMGNPSRHQREMVKRTVVGLRLVLAQHGIVPKRQVAQGEPPLLCTRSAWLYTRDGGLLDVFPDLLDHVEAGQPVARVVDLFGDEVRTYHAPEAGVVIGKAVDPVAASGARILHLGVLATDDHGLRSRA